jgi:hypothetical protein
MANLFRKFLATPPAERLTRVRRYVRDATLHPALLRLKRAYYGDFYIQWRPTAEVFYGGLETARELAEEWYGRDAGLGQDLARVYHLFLNIQALNDRHIVGDFAEVGVYKGSTARILGRLSTGRRLFLFDTFAGFDAGDVVQEELVGAGSAPKEDFSDTSVEKVRATLGDCHNVVFCQGRFPDTTRHVPNGTRFALLHFDADLYEPARAACSFFYPLMSPGGLMIFHNYADPSYPGCKRAVDEFFADKRESVVIMPDMFGTAMVSISKSLNGHSS